MSNLTVKFMSICFIAFTGGCSSAASDNGQSAQHETIIVGLEKELTLAVQAQDYRLFTTATRGVNVPGLDNKIVSEAVNLCGKKYMPQTGDVITSEQDRNERKKVLIYMEQYNLKMWSLCQKNNVGH